MAERYLSEELRQAALNEILVDVLPGESSRGKIEGFPNNRQLSIRVGSVYFLYYIQELKDELGSTRAEPNFKGGSMSGSGVSGLRFCR
jgi:hypothetical protein